MNNTPVLDIRPESAATIGGELATTTAQLTDRLAACAVENVTDLEQAVLDRQQLGDAMKSVTAFFAVPKSLAYQLHRTLCDRENAILKPLEVLDRAKADAISRFKAAKDREREEAERAAAERERVDRESRAASEAAALERAGDSDLAAAVIAEAVAAPSPVVTLPDVTRQVADLSFVRRWYWKYAGGPADLKRTPPQVIARTMALIPRDYLMVDEKKIGAYARSMKGSAKIPGIDIYFKDDPVR